MDEPREAEMYIEREYTIGHRTSSIGWDARAAPGMIQAGHSELARSVL